MPNATAALPVLAVALGFGFAAHAATPAAQARSAPETAEPWQTYDPATIRSDDTLASLQQRLGKDAVVAGEVPGAEGTESGWILHPKDPSRRVYIYVDEGGQHPDLAVVRDAQSRWQTAERIHMGLSTRELAARNIKPFTFTGFNWDYGGRISDWHGGALRHAKGVVLCPPEFAGDRVPKGYPEGDGAFASTLPILTRFPPSVCGFDLELAPAGGRPAEAH